LAPVLTILLTLYIAFFAISLLTGRAPLGISALTPRMMTLGLVLTFATSWIAYQGVVWNLATGAPDQIASVLTGTNGSATQVFADRIDIVFAAIGQVAEAAGAGQGGGQAENGGSFTPGNLMWLAALLLMIGTVGVLVTARIALAVLLAIGPVFVVFALFDGTRGLTAGWLRGVVLTAVTPLFVVVAGGITLELIVPVVAALSNTAAQGVDGRAAMALFMVAFVHVALMVLVLKVTTTMVAGWSVFGLAGRGDSDAKAAGSAAAAAVAASSHGAASAASAASQPAQVDRRAAIVAPVMAQASAGGASGSGPAATRDRHTVVTHAAPSTTGLPALARSRAHGVGSRFRAPARHARQGVR
jgi:type IV secretion system protein VirB6